MIKGGLIVHAASRHRLSPAPMPLFTEVVRRRSVAKEHGATIKVRPDGMPPLELLVERYHLLGKERPGDGLVVLQGGRQRRGNVKQLIDRPQGDRIRVKKQKGRPQSSVA